MAKEEESNPCPEHPRLSHVGLKSTSLPDVALSLLSPHLSRVMLLNLGRNPHLTDASLQKVTKVVRHLKRLQVRNTEITIQPIQTAIDSCHELDYVDVRECKNIKAKQVKELVLNRKIIIRRVGVIAPPPLPAGAKKGSKRKD